MKASEVLRKAREIMNNAGEHWTVGTLAQTIDSELGIQRFCAIGGLNAAAGLPQDYAERIKTYHSLTDLVDAYEARVRATLILGEAIGYTDARWTGYEYVDVTPESATVSEAENVIMGFNDGQEDTLRSEGREAAWNIVAAKLEEAAELAESRND